MNLFAYTAPGGDYPGYVSINSDDAGNVSVTVREPPKFHTVMYAQVSELRCAPGEQARFSIPADAPEAKQLASLATPSGEPGDELVEDRP